MTIAHGTSCHSCLMTYEMCCELAKFNILREPCLMHNTIPASCHQCTRRQTRRTYKGSTRRNSKYHLPIHVSVGYPKPSNCHPDFCRELKRPNPACQNLNEATLPKTRHTSFCTLNARSLRKKPTEFQDFVESNNVDVVGICETWLTQSDEAVVVDFTPPGYVFKHEPRSGMPGGGVGILFRNELNITVNTPSSDVQSFKVLSATMTSNNESLNLFIIYRPPSPWPATIFGVSRRVHKPT